VKGMDLIQGQRPSLLIGSLSVREEGKGEGDEQYRVLEFLILVYNFFHRTSNLLFGIWTFGHWSSGPFIRLLWFFFFVIIPILLI
jgi:hypothetical protein